MMIKKMDEQNPFKILKVHISSSPTPTINMVDSNLEEEVIAYIPVTVEVDQNFQ